ncbi:MAG: carbohydrate-binding domain-containing protein [Treponema sp.]|nr:carbohydrate-binding domain-containing protein [Treponema sp.]
MNKSLRHLFAGLALLAPFLCACSNASDSSFYTTGLYSQGGGGAFPGGGTGGAAPTASTALNVEYGDNVADTALAAVSWSDTIYLDLTNSKYLSDGSSWSAISTDSANPSAVAENVSIYNNSGYIKIDTSGTTDPLKFVLSGTLSSGELVFANKKNSVIGVCMNGASITSGNYPCVEFENKGTVYLVLGGTNSLTDGRKYGTAYSDEHKTVAGYIANASESKGTFHAKGVLNISAADSSSKLTVTEGYKHGINASDTINFYGGIVTVNSTGRNGFQCKNAFNMYGGTAIVYGDGAHTNNESRGIVVEGDDTGDTNGLGYFNMTGGAVNIKTVSKAITAKWDSDDASETSKVKCTVNPIVTISGGKINIVTYGTPKEEASTASSFTDADGETVSEKIKLSPEGIEGKAGVTITGGTLNITTTDDCINASSGAITISGGTIYAYSSANDCIDSNGTLTISGGTIVALTATTPECAFDCDNNNFAITGGTLIGIGTTNYSKPTAASCGQSVVVVGGNYLGSAGTTFALEDSTGAAAFAFTIPSAVYSSLGSNYVAIISSPKIAAGTSYALYSGVTATGGSNFNGLYTSLPTVSGGASSLTGIATSTSSWVYTNASSGAGQGGQQPGGTPPTGF